LVAEPQGLPQPRKVKLRMPARSPEPPRLKLRFGGQKSSGSIGPDVVKSGTNRRETATPGGTSQFGAPNPFGRSFSGSGSAQTPSLHPDLHDGVRNVFVEQAAAAMNGVKNELPFGQSPALGAVNLNRETNSSTESIKSPNRAASTMPPPLGATPRLESYSPHLPAAASNSQGWNAQPTGSAHDMRGRQPVKGKHGRAVTVLHANRFRCG
jgi:hypothetical protein